MTEFNDQMNFEIIRDSINTILAADATDNNFELIKFANDSSSAESTNKKRKVHCYYDSSVFPTVDNRQSSDQTKETPRYKIIMDVAAKSKDTDDGYMKAGLVANENIDDLIRRVYQILMQGENLYLGTDLNGGPRYGIISDRAIENIQKTPIQKDSAYALISATMDITCITNEVAATIADNVLDDVNTTIELNEDENAKTGVQNTYP
jgi:hypothetical protein